jgi:hypothetical protein
VRRVIVNLYDLSPHAPEGRCELAHLDALT